MADLSKEMQISIEATSMFPGFKFSPTDEELISYYLKKKLEGFEQCVEVIFEIEIWKHEPWDLPAKSVIQSETEWFFFTPRGKKYPNGSQSKRATESGYWKATGKERNVKSGSNVIGTKRTLVFHLGRAPKGERTEWIMHEYCINGKSQDCLVVCRLRKNSEFRLNDSPRKGSRRRLSTGNDNNFALSEVAIDQPGLSGGAKAVECCSKEYSSSYNSHSVEQQIDSGSESDHRPANELCQPESSSHWKGCDDDDCFADIMKDDIIKLEEPSDRTTHDHLLPMISMTPEAKRKSKQPVQASMQGTANRRISLSRQKPRTIKVEHLGGSEVIYESQSSQEIIIHQKSELLPNRTSVRHVVSVFVVMLALLVMFVSLLGGHWQVKWFRHVS